MLKGNQYRLRLASLPQGVSEYDYSLGTEFFQAMENPDVLAADLKAHVRIEHKNDAYHLSITLVGEMQVPCDRCLDAMPHDVDASYEVVVKYGADYDDSIDGVLVLPESENFLDLAQLLYDTAVLTIPMRHVHEPGKCNPAMEAIMHEHEDDNDSSEPLDEP